MKRNLSVLLLTSIMTFTSCGGEVTPTPSPSGDRYFKVVWKNYDGTILETDKRVKENTIPTYDGSTPTRPDDSSYTYSFSGWNPTVTIVTMDTIYTATFTSSPKGGGDPSKVEVPAHTLKDSNPPVDSSVDGEIVSESTWNNFKNAAQSGFSKQYNYTYRAYSGGTITTEQFTKNGYYVSNSYTGELYYERKSGNTFYEYFKASDGWSRQETSLNLTEKYTYRIWHELYLHIFEFSEYTFEEGLGGYYRSYNSAYSSVIKFKNGYITEMRYILNSPYSMFEIYDVFKTEIDIPKSYYIK